ncbi:hypothetical protein FEV53_19005 [Palleronia caenipelagi]|uniref:Uncharacterized protein n=2 Tax=Palleronia caenipelagi TaxID=2489174 RepID=A0A547PJW5_9RHOB|nr:hypothetical protein [Palleronia caenipelagi]TRD14407.1 hypothetical protein FEV53_19005 [Palleronia caenipelagi]
MDASVEFQINYIRDQDDPRSGPVQIGWTLADDASAPKLLFYPPERVRSPDVSRTHAKSASRCPAIINLESRYFLVRCPFDLHLVFKRDADGRPALVLPDGKMAAVRKSKMDRQLAMVAESEWRYPDRPTIQLKLPYLFFADEPVYMSQIAPFMNYINPPWPGTIFGGRFPIMNWPRPLMWAFEWRDLKQPLKIRRGDPLFYLHFEVDRPDRAIQMLESELTPEVQTYLDHISGAVNFANQTFSLFDQAARVRPQRLVVPKKNAT